MKVVTSLKPALVFADESGKLSDPNQDLVILTTLIIYSEKMAQVNARFNHLKETVAKWDIDITDPKFRFHSHDIFSPNEPWRKLSNEQREKVAKLLRNSVKEPDLSFVVVLLDKKKRGFSNLLQLIDNVEKEALSGFTRDQLTNYNRLLAARGIRKGVGDAGQAASLLFGLTTALMHWEGFRGDAKVIPDNQFLSGIETWQLIYAINSGFFDLLWPVLQSELEKEPALPQWSRNNPPKWHLGEAVDPTDAYKYFGLQLADFIAYTALQIAKSSDGIASSYALFGEKAFVAVPFNGADGVKVCASSKPRIRTSVKPFNTKERSRWVLDHRGY
jgi:hypothetical protein